MRIKNKNIERGITINVICLIIGLIGGLCILYVSISIAFVYKNITTYHPKSEELIFMLNAMIILWYIIHHYHKMRNQKHSKIERADFDSKEQFLPFPMKINGKKLNCTFVNSAYNKLLPKLIMYSIICMLTLYLGFYDFVVFPYISWFSPKLFIPMNIGSLIGLIACINLFVLSIKHIYVRVSNK